MSDVKRVTLTTISDVVRKGGGAGGGMTTMSTGSTIMASSSSFGGGAFSQFELPNAAAAAAAASPFASSSSSMFGGAAGSKDAMGGGTPGNNGSSGSGSSKKQKTVRLELNLFEPTADSFPEFNFSKLIHEEQKRLKKLQKKHEEEANGFLSDPELDNDVARMARELELKYGSGSAYASSKSSKHARPSKLDYCDRGAGYDEEDSFIDNSEAYDELMPQEIETVGGGFYINSGQLEFKQLSNFERPEDAQRMPKPKKRALSTSSESSDGEAEPETAEAKSKSPETTNAQPPGDKVVPNHKDLGAQPQQQQQPPVQPMECQSGTEDDKATSTVPVSTGTTVGTTGSQDEKVRLNGHVSKKQKLNDNGQSAAPKGGGASVTLETMVEEKLVHSTASGALPVPEGEKDGKSNGVKGTGKPTNAASSTKKDEAVLSTEVGVKTIKTTTVKDMLRAKRDSLRKMEQEKKGRSSGSSRVSSSEAEEDGDDGGGDEDDEEDDDDNDDDDDDDDEDDEDEDDDEDEGRSEKNSHDTRSEVDIGSDSESSRESTGQKAVANVSASVPSTMPNSTVTTTANAVASTIVSAAAADPPMMNGGPMETEQHQQQQQTEERKRKECKLPDGIGESLRKDIGTLLELANGQAGGGGKLNYFDSKVADLMLQIDEACRSYGGSGSNSTRNVVFRYLEAHLSISRQSLQLKLKKIRIRWLENRSKSTLGRLESTVNQMMPAILAKYELDCAKVQEIRAAQQAQAAATAAAAASAASTVSGSSSATTSMTNGAEKPDAAPSSVPQVRNPKKRFPWNDRSSVLLWDLFTLRSDMYGLVRPRNETQEEFVAEYLRTRVVPLWPKGWIRYEDLQKELDRRKKVLAKIQGAAAAAASTGAVTSGGVKEPHSKKPIIMLSPLTSPGPPESTGTKTNGVPSSATDMSMSISGSQRSTSSQSTSGSKSKQTDSERSPSGATGGMVATSTASHPYMGDRLSPNHSSLHKRTSDHSISNIMNSPPLPPPASTTMDSRHSPGEANRNASGRSNHTDNRRCSFDDDHSAAAQAQQRLEPVVVSSTSSKDGSSPRRVHFPGITDGKGSSSHHHHHRRASREEDSDSSIEIIAEYSMTAGGAPAGGGGGSKGSGGMSGSNMSPMGGASLPVLNREKYKNLIAGKTKSGSTTSSHAGSPIATSDLPSPMGTPGGSSGSGLKYSKHSPAATVSGSTSASPSFNSSMSNPVGGGATGLPFAIPSGAVSGGGSSLDIVDVQQIMKDLKELQELQQHHSVGGNSGSSSRKVPDTSTLQNQQQQQQQQSQHNDPSSKLPNGQEDGTILVD